MNVDHTLHSVQFQWNSEKVDSNLRKHGITFVSACEAFFDPFLYALRADEADGELRGTVIGLTTNWQMLYVVYTFREEIIRLISARNATRTERLTYENR